MQPKYPIYIISKGRADSRLTSKTLDEIRVPYKIVIEESEFDAFGTGHSSTSISAALGLAEANSLKGKNTLHIAVIGENANDLLCEPIRANGCTTSI